jgi:GntR family transcriptional regulator
VRRFIADRGAGAPPGQAEPASDAAAAAPPPPARRSRDAKYQTIRDTLRRRILDGRAPAGVQLPSESALMRQFAVSRITVRAALRALREAGLVTSRQGKGYFVRPLRAVQNLGRLEGFGEMMAAAGADARSVVLGVAEIAAPAAVRAALRLDRDAPVTVIERVRIGNGIALSYDVSYFPTDLGRRLAALDLSHADIFALLETALGIDLGYADLRFEIAAAGPVAARHLALSPDAQLVHITRLTHDLDGRPIDFEYLYARQDAFQFRVRLPRW